MFIYAQQLLSTLFSTALGARFEARSALDDGDYGNAADRYMTAAERLGNEVLSPYGSQPLFPDFISSCASAACRIALEEGQRVEKKAAIEKFEMPDDQELLRLIGVHRVDYRQHGILRPQIRREHHTLTPEERILLVLHDPLAAPRLVPDLGIERLYFSSDKADHRGVRELFTIRRLAALAAQNDSTILEYSQLLHTGMTAMECLGRKAIHSDSAHRALSRLADMGVEGAKSQMDMVRSERHSIFKAGQSREQQLRDDAIRRSCYYLSFPRF